MALSLLPRSRGYLVLHAAGVVRGDGGHRQLQGPAGAGKSTLAMACARRGFGVFAEDAVFARARPTTLELWGMPWVQRLLPDAAAFFPELAGDPATPAAERRDQARGGPRPGPAGAGRPVRDRRGRSCCWRADTGGPTRIEPVEDATAHDALEIHWPWDGGWSAQHDHAAELLAAPERPPAAHERHAGRGGRCDRAPDGGTGGLDRGPVTRPSAAVANALTRELADVARGAATRPRRRRPARGARRRGSRSAGP